MPTAQPRWEAFLGRRLERGSVQERSPVEVRNTPCVLPVANAQTSAMYKIVGTTRPGQLHRSNAGGPGSRRGDVPTGGLRARASRSELPRNLGTLLSSDSHHRKWTEGSGQEDCREAWVGKLAGAVRLQFPLSFGNLKERISGQRFSPG